MACTSVLVISNERPNNRLECPICKERFLLKCQYTDHLATHEHSRVSCNICSKSFYDQKLLDEHYLTHTNVIKTYDCKECERKFLQKYQLDQHKQFHQPVILKQFAINKKKNVHFNKVAQIKKIINETSESEDFHTSDSADEDECNSSDFEDYFRETFPATVKTRSGRTVKRKKLFDEEETKDKCKSPKTDKSCTGKSPGIEYQKNQSSKLSKMNVFQKKSKTKLAFARKSSVMEYNNKKMESSETSGMDAVQKNIIDKKLSVIVERMPDHIYMKYLKESGVFTKSKIKSGYTQESPKITASKKSVFKKFKSLSTDVSINSIKCKKPKLTASNFHKDKLKQINFKNDMAPNLFKKSDNSATSTTATDKSKNTTYSKVKNIDNSPCSKTVQVGKFSNGNNQVPSVNANPLCKRTSNIDKSILSTVLSHSPALHSPCKEILYVGPNKPDFNTIKQAIEVSTLSNHETSACKNNSSKLARNKTALNSPNSDINSKRSMQLSNNVLPTSFNTKDVLKNPKESVCLKNTVNSQNINQLSGSISNEEGILERKIVGQYTVVRVTPEYMKKIQRNPLKESGIPSIQNLQSASKQMTETMTALHTTSNINKSSPVISKNHEVLKESQKSNVADSTLNEANTINNRTKTCQESSIETSVVTSPLGQPKVITSSLQSPNKQIKETTSVSASSAVSNFNKSATLLDGKHLASILNKSLITPAKKTETKENQKSSVTATTSAEINATKICQKNSVEIPIFDASNNSSDHTKMLPICQHSDKQLTVTTSDKALPAISNSDNSSNLSPKNDLCSQSSTASAVKIPEIMNESHESNTIASSSFETQSINNVAKTSQRSSVEASTIDSSDSSLEYSRLVIVESPQSSDGQLAEITTTDASIEVSDSNQSLALPAEKHLVSNVNETLTAFVEKSKDSQKAEKEWQKLNAVVSTSVETNNIVKTCQSSDKALVVNPSSSSLEQSIQCFQPPNNQIVTSANALSPISNSNKNLSSPVGKYESPKSIISVEPNKSNNKKPAYQSYLIQSPVYSPIILVHTSTPAVQSSAVSLNHMSTPILQSSTALAQTKVPTIPSPATVSVAHSKIQSPQTTKSMISETPGNVSDVNKHSTLPRKKRLTRSIFFEEPYASTDSKYQFNKKDNLKTYQKVTVETPVMCKKTDENTQMSSQSILNKLRVEDIPVNLIAESAKEQNNSVKSPDGNHKDNLTEDAVSSNINDNVNVSNIIEEIQITHDENEQTSTQTTNLPQTQAITLEVINYPEIELLENNHQNQKSDDNLHEVEDECRNDLVEVVSPTHEINEIEISSEKNSNLNIISDKKKITKKNDEIIAIINNSFEVEETVVTLNEKTRKRNIQVSPYSHHCTKYFVHSNIEDLLGVKNAKKPKRTKSTKKEPKKRSRLHVNKCKSNSIKGATISKNVSVTNNLFEVNDNNLEVCRQNPDLVSEIVINLDENVQVPPQSNKNDSDYVKMAKKPKNEVKKRLRSSKNNSAQKATTTRSKNDTIISNSFEVSDINLEICKQNPAEVTSIILNKNTENIQVSQQNNVNDLLAVNITKKPNRTKSVEKEVKKRLRSHINKCENNPPTATIFSKNEQTSVKSSHASSSKTVKKQKGKTGKNKHSEINEKESKNQPNSLSNVKAKKNDRSKETSPKSNQDNKLPKNLTEKLRQRYQAKLEEKERKKKEKYEFKKKMKYIEKLLGSPSTDPIDGNFSQEMLTASNISVDDIVEMSGKCPMGTKQKTDVSQVTKNILNVSCASSSQDSTNSISVSVGNDSKKNRELENAEEAEVIAKGHSISLKFNKDLTENEYLQLLDEIDELIDTYNIGDKCSFLHKTIRFCCLFVESYKVRQKAISLRTKLKNKSS